MAWQSVEPWYRRLPPVLCPALLPSRIVARSSAVLPSDNVVSRPVTIRFYLDVLADAAAPPLAGALAELAPLVTTVRVLGCYAADPAGLPKP